jgi:predicted site-specific integrase-resolvase
MIISIEKLLALLPPYLVILIFVLVILPSLATIYLRFALHKHLVFLEKRVRRLINQGERGNQPEIIQELERRFKEASSNLDHVNTAALIDQVYSREKVLFFSCEQIDYLCRNLPNLLIAFGLLGTFIGITVNLTSLSQSISQTNTNDVNSLVRELQEPLKGMGIAFTTSLTGIFCSASLTIVNLTFNTNVAKYKLISAIEDYLDNIYLPKVQGNNRLDQAVDRLVLEFKDFLGRFGTTVRDAVESSLGAKIQQIVDVNKQASELARQVYTGFQESSGTISSSASEFKYAVSNFENSVVAMIANAERYQQVAQLFEDSQFPEKLSKATGRLADIQNKFSQSAFSLANTAESIEMAVIEARSSSQNITNLAEQVSNINQTSIQVLELHQSSQQSLCEIIPQLKEGAQSFQLAVTKLNNLEKRVVDKPDSWSDVQVELTQLVETLKNYTEQENLGIENVGDRFVKSISNQTESNKYHLQAIEQKLQQCTSSLLDTNSENLWRTQLLEKPEDTNKSSDSELKLVNQGNQDDWHNWWNNKS